MNPPSTQWSKVLEAQNSDSGPARAALASLCELYWLPIYVYIRSRGYQVADAEELTQGFFAELLDKQLLKKADPGRGKFRNFLLTLVQHYVGGERRIDQAQRRGGGRAKLSFEILDAERRSAGGFVVDDDPQQAYCRQWALTLLEICYQRLASEQDSPERKLRFQLLNDYVTATDAVVPYDQLAEQAGVASGLLRVSVHRLRARYGELLREEIARTLGRGESIDSEIDELFSALAQQSS